MLRTQSPEEGSVASPPKQDALTLMRKRELDLVFIAPRVGLGSADSLGYRMRRTAVDFNVPIVTNFKLFELLVASLYKYNNSADRLPCTSIDDHYKASASMYF